MLPLGTLAPDFQLPNVVTGEVDHLMDLRSPEATVIMFICNHCPYVKHIQYHLVDFAKHYMKKNVSFIAISSNDAEAYPEDAPEKMRQLALELDFPFPYLYDESQTIAKAYDAACTPDFYIFDEQLKCVYRGRYDASRPGQDLPVTGQDLAAAIDAILAKQSPLSEQYPSIGCNIKWKNKSL